MTTLQQEMELYPAFCETADKIGAHIHRQKRLCVLLENSESHTGLILDIVREEIQEAGGQFLALRLSEMGELSLPHLMEATLSDQREFRISLPLIMQNNPQSDVMGDVPFINRALLWQRLCDGIIADENSQRPTVLVLEQFDPARRDVQQDLARIIRFHESHNIRRTFLITMPGESLSNLSAELRQSIDRKNH